MARFLLTTVMVAGVAACLCGCMTTAFAPTAADVQAYAIKSVSVSGVAPQAVSESVSSDLSSAIRSSAPKSATSSPVQMTVAISGFSGSRVATGYKAGADVTVTLKPTGGGKVVQTASFHEDAVSIDEARASSQLATGIAARVRRNFNLPASQAATASNTPRAAAVPSKKAAAAKPASPEKSSEDAALSSDALDTLMRAAAGGETPQDQTKTSSVPGQTVPVPDAACTGDSLAACPQGALLSGDFSLRK